MNRRLAVFSLIASPMLAGVFGPTLIHLCIVLFLIFPPLVLLCLIPGAGLLPNDLSTFL